MREEGSVLDFFCAHALESPGPGIMDPGKDTRLGSDDRTKYPGGL